MTSFATVISLDITSLNTLHVNKAVDYYGLNSIFQFSGKNCSLSIQWIEIKLEFFFKFSILNFFAIQMLKNFDSNYYIGTLKMSQIAQVYNVHSANFWDDWATRVKK